MNASIHCVYFDIGGVLLRWQEFFESIAINYEKSRRDVEACYFRYDDLACRGEISTQIAWENACRDLHISPTSDVNFATGWIETFTPIAPSHRLLRKIAKKLPVGLLTNIHSGTYELTVQKKLVPDIPYKAVVQSCNVGCIKPEKEIYEIAQKQAGVSHKHIFFTDDLAQNIETARSIGWQAVQFQTDQPEQSVQEIQRMLQLNF